MKKIAILGSTGSIGRNTLRVIDENRDKFEVLSLAANNNYQLLYSQYYKYRPKYLSVSSKEGYKYLKDKLKNENVEICFDKEGLKSLGGNEENDIVVNAVSGSCGLEATIEALKKGKRIALANKESLVAGGELIQKIMQKTKGEIIPVDSEHSAIFQLIEGKSKIEIKKLILTASGGPFIDNTKEELEKVSLKEALQHPNWEMGQKITVDSATLVNKGLEIIEAHYLFDMEYEKIDFVIHPESIIHSLVEFVDNSLMAQIGVPDMKLPIQYALSYPKRLTSNCIEKFDFMKNSRLSFKNIDRDLFKGIDYAYYAGKTGKTMPLVFNAANEEAVKAFIEGKIKFLDIYRVIEKAMEKHKIEEVIDMEILKMIETDTRDKAKELILNL